MTEIPTGERAARDAWNALPEAVRRDALSQASRGEAAADPSVAAIIAGVVRVREPHRSWSRRMAGALPFAVLAGALIALQYFGLLSVDGVMRTAPFVAAGIVALIVVASSAVHVIGKLRNRRAGEGLRFGFGNPVPWRDVLGVEYAGPTAAFPDAKAGLVWRLRDRSDVRIDLDAVTTPPERIVRAAQAYQGRRSLLT